MCSKSVSIEGKKISYYEKGQGQTIVFLHGYLETKEVWDDFVSHLSDEFRLICIDIPGHGESEVIAESHEMDIMANRINDLLEGLAISNYTLVGHSMGGYVSLALANQFSKKINGLVLFHSSVYADNDEKRNNRRREIDFIKQGKKDLLLNVNLPKMFADSNVDRFTTILNQIQNRAKQMNENGICSILRGMMSRDDQQEFVANFTKPMLFIFGEKDNFIPVEAGKNMLALNPEIKGEWLKHSGHMGFIEEKEKSLGIIRKFAKGMY